MKSLALAILGLAWFAAPVLAAPTLPYGPSAVIKEMKWHWETYTNAAIGSDLWPVTWGPDDNLYTAWGDGGGFGGGDHDGRVAMGFARIEGTPEHWRGVNINGGKNPEHPASFPVKGKTAGLLFVKGTVYAIVNLQDGVWPNVNHVLTWSTNSGATWSTNDWLFARGEGSFQPAVFLNFGKDYAGVPGMLGSCVYIYGTKHLSATQNSREIYLARVPVDRMKEQDAYEFFAGAEAGGKIKWAHSGAEAQPAFFDPNNDGIGSVQYAPAIKRYLLASFHGGPGQLGVFDAPNPWGPWTTVCYLEDFGRMGADGEGLVCAFPQKWMSADGSTLWAIFSCYGGSAKEGIHAHDRFNLVKATVQFYPVK
jgi:hypothetical protein